MEQRFGDVPVVVEEFLIGVELSLLALCDGENAIPLAPARDFKRIGEGDSGPNTGGMGAYSPVDGADAELIEDVRVRVLQPVVDELARRGTPFHGVLYAGPDAHRRRPEGARVQRPLRRSRDPGRAPAPALATCSTCSARDQARRPGGRASSSGTSARR